MIDQSQDEPGSRFAPDTNLVLWLCTSTDRCRGARCRRYRYLMDPALVERLVEAFPQCSPSSLRSLGEAS